MGSKRSALRRSCHPGTERSGVIGSIEVICCIKKTQIRICAFLVAGAGLERCDLWVMSPTSYQLLHPASRLSHI